MLKRIEDMPSGAIGVRASGKVSREDYRDVLVPALEEAVEQGEVRLMYVAEPGFAMEAGAVLEDAKAGLGLRHLSAWKRTAFVTDIDWLRSAVHAFAWMAPGEVMVCGLDQEDEARLWVAG